MLVSHALLVFPGAPGAGAMLPVGCKVPWSPRGCSQHLPWVPQELTQRLVLAGDVPPHAATSRNGVCSVGWCCKASRRTTCLAEGGPGPKHLEITALQATTLLMMHKLIGLCWGRCRFHVLEVEVCRSHPEDTQCRSPLSPPRVIPS